MSRILVVYATWNGSTRQVAETIATVAAVEGWQVHLAPVTSIREPLADWDLVVLGARLYSGRWHPGAHRFIKRHRDALSSLPVAVFGMGPRSNTDDAWQRSRAQLDRALAKRAWLIPRDWTEVRAWARKVLALVVPT
jgi:menaquinone-dependent protoporphyrinogen oxidase